MYTYFIGVDGSKAWCIQFVNNVQYVMQISWEVLKLR